MRLPEALGRALQQSKKLVVLCSPTARDSLWVNEEIHQFARQKGADHILPLLVAGRPNAEAERLGAMDEAAFPPAVIDALGPEPWAPDFRTVADRRQGVKTNRAAWFHLLASLYGTTRAVVEQRERLRRMTQGAVAVLCVVVIGSAAYAFARIDAMSQSRALANKANVLAAARLEEATRTATLAVEQASTEEATAALRRRLEDILKPFRTAPGEPSSIAVDETGRTVVIASPFGQVRVWRHPTGAPYELCGYMGPLKRIALSPNGATLVWFDEPRNTLGFWDIDSRNRVERPSGSSSLRLSGPWITFSPDSTMAVITPYSEKPSLWRLADVRMVTSLDTVGTDAITFSRDGSRFAQYDGSRSVIGTPIVLRRSADGATLRRLEDGGTPELVRFSGDGTKLVVLSQPRRSPSISETIRPEPAKSFVLIDSANSPRQEAIQRFSLRSFDYRELLAVAPRRFDTNDLTWVFTRRLRERYPRLLGPYSLSDVLMAEKAPVAVGLGDGRPWAFAFDALTLKLNPPLAGLEEKPSHPALSPDGGILASLGGPVWDLFTGTKLWELATGFDAIMFSSDGGRLFGLTQNARAAPSTVPRARAVAYEARTGRELARFITDADDLVREPPEEPLLRLLHLDADGRNAVIRSEHAVYLWSIDQQTARRLDGTFKSEKERVALERKMLESPVDPRALSAMAQRWLRDCPGRR